MIEKQLKRLFPYFWQSLSNSYTQVFFSKSKVLSVLLIVVSMFDLNAGLSGLMAVLMSNIAAYVIGLNRQKVIDGLYGFNGLLVGLGLGVYYHINLVFIVVLLFVSILTLLLTTSLEGILYKYGLPYLSIPFLFGIWIVSLSARHFAALELSQRGIYMLNDMYLLGGLPLVKVYEWFHTLAWPEPIKIYFRSLGAIFFQYHLFAGLLVAVGLLIWSRLAFLMSVAGYTAAWFFYVFIGANIGDLSYNFIGFNYILTSIAIGVFFVIPSRSSIVWVLFSVPLLAFLIIAGSVVLDIMQLSVLSLPFNIVVIMFVYLFKVRERFHDKPTLVYIQQYSPEKNLYSFLVNRSRLSHLGTIPMKLPFWGKWKVTQGIDGEHTHKDVWRHAWDFEMTDEEGKTYKEDGFNAEDYYCFNKPVIAPANGYITEITDGLNDNVVGDADIKNNWGNSIVISHAAGLFSQLSHLKKGSVLVAKGQYVVKGEQIANCGNSGRSPYPHLHFQFQSAGEIGAPTLDYPFSAFLTENKESIQLSTSQPLLNDTVVNINTIEALDAALHFVPGQQLHFKLENGTIEKEINWKIKVDIYNNSYLQCDETGAKAWFIRQPEIFYFTHFEGNRKSALFDFFLGAYQLLTGFVAGLKVNENITLALFPNIFLLGIQDFIAPFYRFLNAEYTLVQKRFSNDLSAPRIIMASEVRFSIFKHEMENRRYEIVFAENQLDSFTIHFKDTKTVLTRV